MTEAGADVAALGDPVEALAAVVRDRWGRLASTLLGQFRRLDLVEDALGDAVEAASRSWPGAGVPDNPAGWVFTAARRRILDRLRAEAVAARRMPLLVVEAEHRQPVVRADPGDLIEDDLLRLVLMCSHPALEPAAASALSLRLVLGVNTPDVARLFLVGEATMAARITRAKKKIVGAGIPFSIPDAGVLPDRLAIVAQTAYLAFTAGYAPGSGPDAVRVALAGEAIRMVRVVLELRPDEPVLLALLALMLLQHSRRDARVDVGGRIVLLPDQDRSRWHRAEVAEARKLLGRPVLRQPLTEQAASYLLQAHIAAEHAAAAESGATSWARVVRLYDTLLTIAPSPSARLARAVAVAEAEGPDAGLAALHELEPDLLEGHRLPAVRAELLVRQGDLSAAGTAYDLAIARCRNDAERAHLERRRAALELD